MILFLIRVKKRLSSDSLFCYYSKSSVYKNKYHFFGSYGVLFGGPPGARTLDPLIKSQMLYQLS